MGYFDRLLKMPLEEIIKSSNDTVQYANFLLRVVLKMSKAENLHVIIQDKETKEAKSGLFITTNPELIEAMNKLFNDNDNTEETLEVTNDEFLDHIQSCEKITRVEYTMDYD